MSDLILGAAKDLVKWLAAGLFGMGWWVWRKTDAKVDSLDAGKAGKSDLQDVRRAVEQLQTDLKGKADESEMWRQRDNIAALFTAQTGMRQDMHANHVAMMTAVNTIATQVANIAGRLDKDQ